MDLKGTLNKINITADWIGLRRVTEETNISAVRDFNPQANVKSVDTGLMVEALVDGQFGYYGTHSLDPESIQKAADQAAALARSASNDSVFNFSHSSVRPPNSGKYVSPRSTLPDSLSLEQINSLLVDANKWLKYSDEVVSIYAMLRYVNTRTHFVSSSGADIEQDFIFVNSPLSVTAKDGSVIQTRSESDTCYQAGLEDFNETSLKARCGKLTKELSELLVADECPNETLPLVISSDQMMLQIHESIGHALEIDRILGDEKNYAGWSFVKMEDFGSLQYGSDLMNITFNPTLEGEFASYDYDDSGHKAEKEFLIKDGLLVRGLGGLESQSRSGLDSVANFRASSWNRAPIDRMANLNLEPGSSTLDEIIGSVERGVYMETNKCWSIDDYRRKFQFGCEYGKMIEDGKLTKTIKNPNYRSISVPFWNSLTMLGDESTFNMYGTPYCGKGEPNQSIRVGHASPACLFNNIEVFGGV